METEKKTEQARPLRSANSILTGIPGLLALLAGFLAANYLGAKTVGAFLLLFFLLCLASACWSRGVCRRIALTARAKTEACYAGQTFFLELGVRNHSFFPLVWLDVLFPAGRRELIRRAEDEFCQWFYIPGRDQPRTGLRQRFVWLLWHQEIRWDEEVVAVRRGCLRIRRAVLQAGDGFGLSACVSRRKLEPPICVYIYPTPVPVRMERFLRITQEAVARSRGTTEDVTLLKGSRAYEPGDPARRINWRLLASSGRLSVNVYETVQPGCAAFVLDLESFRRIWEGSGSQQTREVFLMDGVLEDMISLIASCMEEFARRAIPVALLIPAYDTVKQTLCLPFEDGAGLRPCLEALSEIRYRAQDTHIGEEELWRLGRIATSLFFCVGTDEKNGLEETAAQLGAGRVTFVAGRRKSGGFGEIPCIYLDEACPAMRERGEKEDERVS